METSRHGEVVWSTADLGSKCGEWCFGNELVEMGKGLRSVVNDGEGNTWGLWDNDAWVHTKIEGWVEIYRGKQEQTCNNWLGVSLSFQSSSSSSSDNIIMVIIINN